MVRPGVFDVERRHTTLFDEEMVLEGVYDREMIPDSSAIVLPVKPITLRFSLEIAAKFPASRIEGGGALHLAGEITTGMKGRVNLG